MRARRDMKGDSGRKMIAFMEGGVRNGNLEQNRYGILGALSSLFAHLPSQVATSTEDSYSSIINSLKVRRVSHGWRA